jgi:pathogenesis-related protein 1
MNIRPLSLRLCKPYQLLSVLAASICTVAILPNLESSSSQVPDTIIHPIQPTIRYRRKYNDPAEIVKKNQRVSGLGILTALQGTSRSKLEFKVGKKLYSPLIQAGPDRQTTNYYFPCSALKSGSTIVGWSHRRADSHQCGEALQIARLRPGKLGSRKTDVTSHKDLTGKSAQSPEVLEEVTVSRLKDITLIYARTAPEGITVDVLIGEINVDSGIGDSQVVSAGQRYIYTDATVGKVDQSPQNTANSEPVQQFLDSSDWSSEAQEILPDFRNALNVVNLSDTARELLAAHNQCRSKVGVSPLRWSAQLATTAQEWADYLSTKRNLEHRQGGGSGFGENLAAGSISPTELVNLWCDEQTNYDPQLGQCRSGKCGHFTQVVWRRTQELGCGLASHRRYGKVLVCNYDPPGNLVGEPPF